jgi:transposase
MWRVCAEPICMSRHFLSYSPEQPHLLPAAPQDWMPPDHLAYLVRDLVSELDLSDIYHRYKGARGAPAFAPKMMVGILLYAWASDIYSSRRIAALCVGDLGGRYLAAGHQPDHRTISTFRLQHGEALAGLFVQSVHLCQEAGMVSLGHVAMDGSKLAANASKHKAMSYGRMTEAEERLTKEIAEYQRRCRVSDAEEDTLFGKDSSGYSLPDELKRRETRLARIRDAKAALEAEARAAAEAKAKERERRKAEDEREGGKRRGGRKPKDPEKATPEERAQRNFTDPESRIMKSGKGEWIQGYNGQAVVDRDHQVIVACELTDMAADAPHFEPMLSQVVQNTGGTPSEVSADAGYFSEANVESQLGSGTQPLIPPDRMKHRRDTAAGFCIDHLSGAEPMSAADFMRLILSTQEGARGYSWRKKTVEPVFGQIKGCPGSPGFCQFLRRGLQKARQEWRFVCAIHNFKKYLGHKVALAVVA